MFWMLVFAYSFLVVQRVLASKKDKERSRRLAIALNSLLMKNFLLMVPSFLLSFLFSFLPSCHPTHSYQVPTTSQPLCWALRIQWLIKTNLASHLDWSSRSCSLFQRPDSFGVPLDSEIHQCLSNKPQVFLLSPAIFPLIFLSGFYYFMIFHQNHNV